MVKVTVVTAANVQADYVAVGVAAQKDKKSTPGLKAPGLNAPGLKALGLLDHAEAKRLLTDPGANLGFKRVVSLPGGRRGAPTLVLVGLGDTGKLTPEKIGTALHAVLNHVKGLGGSRVATTLLSDVGGDALATTAALVHGAILGQLSFDQYKSKQGDDNSKKPKAAIRAVQLVAPTKGLAAARTAARDAAIVAEAVNDARLLANTPANIATPKWMASQARSRGRKYGFKVSVKGRAQLRKEGFGALCAVGQGSANEEQLVVMDYHPPRAKKTIAIVGKGVCFDTGGISLKPGQGMWDMKYDKCGACNTMAIMTTLARLKVKHRVIGVTPLVENMPGGTAQRPGDIITAKDGTTIEVLNTDAEGRLILADAITYARTFKPAWIAEMSTLTGACEVAVGPTFVAVTSKDEGLAKSVVAASHAAGDKAWRLPQGEEFDEANKGTYADLQNISLTNKAGTAIGGSFVGHFAKDTPFVHLDIASKAWTSGTEYFAKGPTGAGLRIVLRRLLDEA